MTETEEQRRRQVVTELSHLIPLTMDFHDGCIALTALYDIGLFANFFNDVANDFEDYARVETDADGRITLLCLPVVLDDNDADYIALYYDVPPIVARLQKVKSITIWGSRSIPRELGDLPLLEDIDFNECSSDFFDNIPDGLRLSSLKKAYVWASQIHSLTRFLNMFPSTLELLSFSRTRTEEENNEIYRALENDNLVFRQKLTVLQMSYCNLNNGDFERLIFNIQQLFPNLLSTLR